MLPVVLARQQVNSAALHRPQARPSCCGWAWRMARGSRPAVLLARSNW